VQLWKLLGFIGGTLLCTLLEFVGHITKWLHGYLEMEDATGTTLSKGKDHNYTFAVLHSEKPYPNHAVEMPCQSKMNSSDRLLPDINVQSILKAPANVVKDQCQDVEHFFSPLFMKDRKNHRNCVLCLCISHKYLLLNVSTFDVEKNIQTVLQC